MDLEQGNPSRNHPISISIMCVMNLMLEVISKDFADQRPGIKRIGATFDMGIILKFCPTAWIGERVKLD